MKIAWRVLAFQAQTQCDDIVDAARATSGLAMHVKLYEATDHAYFVYSRLTELLGIGEWASIMFDK